LAAADSRPGRAQVEAADKRINLFEPATTSPLGRNPFIPQPAHCQIAIFVMGAPQSLRDGSSGA